MRNYEISPLSSVLCGEILIGNWMNLIRSRIIANQKFIENRKLKKHLNALRCPKTADNNFIVYRMMIFPSFRRTLNRFQLILELNFHETHFFVSFIFRRKSIAYYFVSRSHNAQGTSLSYSCIKSWVFHERKSSQERFNWKNIHGRKMSIYFSPRFNYVADRLQ